MALINALYTGVSGLRSYGDSLQVIGDNIANVNTVGFKSSRAEFADLISQNLESLTSPGQLGRGVHLSNISTSYDQGTLSNSDRLTDLAINGGGFFIVERNGVQNYTRNGQFHLDNQGQLVTAQGDLVQGYQYNAAGTPLGTIGPVQVSNNSIQPRLTGDGTDGSGVNIQANFDATAEIKANFDVNDATATSNFSTTITVYDSVGAGHPLHVYFNKTAENQWAWHGVMDGGELNGGTAGTPTEAANGTLTFTENGALQATTTENSSFNFTGTAQPIGFSFGETIEDGGSGLNGSTQFANPSVINTQSQDGLPAGELSSVIVESNGIITGVYSNGRTLPIGQLALANFPNLNGLQKMGGGLYMETLDSGQALVGQPDSGSFGSIASYSLELSNVDLAKEFVDLISTQRAYQANSRIITVGDQLMSDLINLVR